MPILSNRYNLSFGEGIGHFLACGWLRNSLQPFLRCVLDDAYR